MTLKKDKRKWRESYLYNKTITIKQGEIVHKFTSNVLPDVKYKNDDRKFGYMEDYYLNEQSQLEKRITIGDSSIWKDLPDSEKKIMKE